MNHVVTFLNGESRQVWALRRDTGEPFFLAEGDADLHREFTKVNLRCPYPGCTSPISTRGGSRRDHFFHLQKPGHETGRESEFHLAAKAMLSQWARTRIPEGATVREEHTIKEPGTSLDRRADVMVTGRSGRQVAYEVEYKSFAVQEWRQKQADYDSKGIACLWLIGHTRVVPIEPSENRVRVPLLAAAIVAAGHPLVLVNPATREIGTLSSSPTLSSHYRGRDVTGWLAIDALDDCTFDPRRGIVTPTMLRIDQAEEESRVKREVQEAVWRRENVERLAMKKRVEGYERQYALAWTASDLHATFLARWGAIPEEFDVDTGVPWGIWAAPAHWHGVIHEELIQERTDDFRWPDVFAALDRHRIRRHWDRKEVFKAVINWLEHIERLGLLKIHRDANRRVLLFSPTGASLEWLRDERLAVEEARRQRDERARSLDGTRRSTYRSVEELQPGESVSDRSRTKLVILPDGRRRFVPK